MNIFEKLKGKKIDLRYEETGYHFLMTYLSEKELKWEAQFEVAEGEETEAIESYIASAVSDDVYTIHWVESTGLTVSQTLDFRTQTVYAFLTWEDENSRGNRGTLLQKGHFQLI